MTPKQLYDILNEALPADCYLGDWHDHPTVTVDGGVDLAALAEKLTAHFARPEGEGASRYAILMEVAMNYTVADPPLFQKWLGDEIGRCEPQSRDAASNARQEDK